MEEKASSRRNPKGEGWYTINSDKTITNKKKYTAANGDVFCKSFRGKTKTEAKRKREKWERENSVEEHPLIVSTMPVPEYMYNWLNTYKKNSIGENSYDAIEDCVESRVKGYDLEHYQIGQLTVDIMQNHINQLVDAEYSKATIKRTASVLRNCFKKAKAKKDIPFNPMDGVELPSEKMVVTKTKKIQFYPPDDMEKIYTEAMRRYSNGALIYSNGPIIVFMMYTGIRIGECQALKWKNASIENKTIIVDSTMLRIKNREEGATKKTLYKISSPKTSTSNRTVHLCNRAVNALIELQKQDVCHCEPEDFVAQSSNHIMISERNLRRTLSYIEKNAGTSIQGAGLHVLRHTFASYAIYKGVDLITLSKILGHSKPSVTSDIYVDVIDKQKSDAISLLDE